MQSMLTMGTVAKSETHRFPLSSSHYIIDAAHSAHDNECDEIIQLAIFNFFNCDAKTSSSLMNIHRRLMNEANEIES
jgi:hypothetical protein